MCLICLTMYLCCSPGLTESQRDSASYQTFSLTPWCPTHFLFSRGANFEWILERFYYHADNHFDPFVKKTHLYSLKDFIIIKSTKIQKSTKWSKVSSKSFSHMIIIFHIHKIKIKSKAEFCLSIECEFCLWYFFHLTQK